MSLILKMEEISANVDTFYMQRALDLAANGIGKVSTNPLVGCVIVKNNKIIGEGWHKEFGGPHAEVNAINEVLNKTDIKGSDIYVTLEPCSHHGKTPPCAELLIRYQPKRVVICNQDPFHLVAGKGINLLQQNNIEVVTDILKEKGILLNKRFFTFVNKQRPYIILKWAQTEDGFIARENYDSKWISNEISRTLVHKWRSEEDAILIGGNTAINDNPFLTTRLYPGKNPVRVILDGSLKVPKSYHLFNNEAKTIIINRVREKQEDKIHYILSQSKHPGEVVQIFFEQNIQSVLIEGGAQVLQKFIEAGLWDEARIFTAPVKFNKGIKAPYLRQSSTEIIHLNGDLLQIIKNDF